MFSDKEDLFASFFHYPIHTHRDWDWVTADDRDDTHQNIGSNDVRVITDRFHKEYLAMEQRHDKHVKMSGCQL